MEPSIRDGKGCADLQPVESPSSKLTCVRYADKALLGSLAMIEHCYFGNPVSSKVQINLLLEESFAKNGI